MGCASRKRVLIVDDNEVDRESVRRLLGRDFDTLEAHTAAAALEVVRQWPVDCVLLDYRLPDLDGVAILDQLVAGGLPVVMLTGQGDETVAVEAMKRGARDYLVKGRLRPEQLRRAVDSALEKELLRQQIRLQKRELAARAAELARQRDDLATVARELREREAKLDVVLRHLPALVWTTDEQLRITSLAGASRAGVSSPSELVGSEVSELVASEADRRVWLEAHRSGREAPSRFDVRIGERWFQGLVEPMPGPDGKPAGVIGAALDVTTNRLFEQQLRGAQKMEALGKLAGGVAHDFNNLLTAVISFTTFARDALPPDDRVAEDLGQVLRAADRGTALARQLLAFSRQRPVEPRSVDLRELLDGLLPMLQRLLGEDVVIETDAPSDVWNAWADPHGLEQIVVNMAVNARDAMPRGGKLRISLRNAVVDRGGPTSQRTSLAPADYVVVSISDEGEGIAPDLQDRVFDPFFTTKPVGRGTGLGLATCYGIALQVGGDITLESEPGRGTTFDVYLQRAAGRPTAGRRSAPPQTAEGGHEMILVVEDDPLIRTLVTRVLRERGYHVLHGDTVEQAASLATRFGQEIDLILTDVVMPGESGPDLVSRIHRRVAGARVLYMSGYADGAIERHGLLDGDAAFLEKPFSPDDLLRKVREVLDGDAPEGR